MKTPALVAALTFVMGSGIAVAGTDSTQSQQKYPLPTDSAGQTQQDNKKVTYVEDVDLFFDTDSAEVDVAANTELADLAKWGRCNKQGAIILRGHADERGPDDHNVDLSARRAAAVRDQLISMGVPQNQIVIEAFGAFGESRGSLQEDRRVTASVEPMGVTEETVEADLEVEDDLSGEPARPPSFSPARATRRVQFRFRDTGRSTTNDRRPERTA